ncbi:hypothetical protein [Dictyobacter vulcani]|uniref:hypothetical protein n=1 Tax=Dictyobacter vulcani TaxID=2607529 RepID=UPI001E309A82|nr:hypothetical protein [Dictyobacter vulcani]
MLRTLFRFFAVLVCSTAIITSGTAFTHAARRPPRHFPPTNFPPTNSTQTNFPPTNAPQAPLIVVQTATAMIPNNAAQDLAATCPAGRIATGGGGAIGPGGIAGGFITTTGPFPATNNPTGWHVIAANASGVTQPLTAWVLCIRS